MLSQCWKVIVSTNTKNHTLVQQLLQGMSIIRWGSFGAWDSDMS